MAVGEARDRRVPAHPEGMWSRQRVDGDLRAVEILALRTQQAGRRIRTDLHLAMAAWAAAGRASGDLVPADLRATRLGGNELTCEGQHRRSAGVGEESEMPDADKAARQD